ncbi:hypothetical protein F0L74_08885 [Chitinophaga agrisoli]|uniref:ADP-ribosylglycohydrolase n=1 Tax=Chitinophaga agrisoli TaxID=2607653 RepID=A0A5B2VXA2_9BACT|nr:ADP-ribosylglycohydrolase family protein [Chitinophaga agrisoli]KAA2242639.1 hypothetical protein F0L74_08885 [Chitinophaga agrisoli]
MNNTESKIKGCILAGAIGDAFGAPLEGIRSLDKLREQYGKNGSHEFLPYQGHWDGAAPAALGVVTDDTTMLACTLAGIIEAGSRSRNDILQKQWQYYLAWGSRQEYGENMAVFIHDDTTIPGYLHPFLYRCAAGKGTLAALLTGKRGSFLRPVQYDCMIGDKRMNEPNAGCGGMMRIAPVAFLYSHMDVVEMALNNAAITHGHIDALNATAATAALISNCLQQQHITAALTATRESIKGLSDNLPLLAAWTAAETAIAEYGVNMDTIELLGSANDSNPFLALPVLSQTVYCLLAASQAPATADSFKAVIRLAANHSGDSDSVAAIVGNCLGAAWGMEALPADWVNVLTLKNELMTLTDGYLRMGIS